jgi:hypothetical protein
VVEGEEFAFAVELMEGFGGLFEGLEVGQVVGVARDGDEGDGGAGLLELGGEGEAGLAGGEGEGDEGGRDVEVVEGAGHRVLAADGGEAERVLGVEGA